MSTTTSEFSKLVKYCRESLSNKLIYNASIEHAKELVKNLIEVAGERKEDIRIVTGHLHKDFYENLCDTIQDTLKKGVKVQLAVLNPDTNLTGHRFSDLIRDNGGEVFKAKEEIKFPHFVLVHDNRYRLETDHEQTKAVACFNDPRIGNFLKRHFHEIISDGNRMSKI